MLLIRYLRYDAISEHSSAKMDRRTSTAADSQSPVRKRGAAPVRPSSTATREMSARPGRALHALFLESLAQRGK